MRYHVNNEGNPGLCHVTIGTCPYGGESGNENHYESKKEAYAAYEAKRKKDLLNTNINQGFRNRLKTIRSVTLFGGALLTTVSLSACSPDDLISIAEGYDDGGSSQSQPSDAGGYEEQSDVGGDESTSPSVEPGAIDISQIYFQGKPLQPSQDEVEQAKNDVQSLKIVIPENPDTVYYNRSEQFGRSFQTGVVGRLEHRDVTDGIFKNEAPQSRAIGGSFIDPYTGTRVEIIKGSKTDTDVDHIIPLKPVVERERDGLSDNEINEYRLQIANDPDNLQVTSSSANRSKGDQTIDQWVPEYDPSVTSLSSDPAQCNYAISTINIYKKYEDYIGPSQSEVDSMNEILSTRCD